MWTVSACATISQGLAGRKPGLTAEAVAAGSAEGQEWRIIRSGEPADSRPTELPERFESHALAIGMNFNDIIPILQIAIGPTILISAVGLLLLTLNNRLMHAIDRARGLSRELEAADASRSGRLAAEVQVIWDRTRLIRKSMVLATLSALLAGLLIITLFIAALSHLSSSWIVTVWFISSLSALVGALIFLIMDVDKSLVALKLELDVTRVLDG